jgi:hypothetical protein
VVRLVDSRVRVQPRVDQDPIDEVVDDDGDGDGASQPLVQRLRFRSHPRRSKMGSCRPSRWIMACRAACLSGFASISIPLSSTTKQQVRHHKSHLAMGCHGCAATNPAGYESPARGRRESHG